MREVPAAEISSQIRHEAERDSRGSANALALMIGVICQTISAVMMTVRRLAVIAGTSFYDKVLAPAELVLVGLGVLLQKGARNAWYHIMISAHSIAVWFGRLKASRLTSVLMLTSVLLIVITSTFYSFGLSLTIDGETVGYVMGQEEYQKNLQQVEARVSEMLGRHFAVNPQVTFSFGVVERDKVLSDEALQQLLYEQISEVSELYVLTVDDVVVGASASEEALKDMINKILNPSADPNVRTEFNRDVQITKKMVDSENVRSYEEMRAMLTSNRQEEKTYKIKSGDTIERIAKNNGITKAQLMEYNPGLNPGKLRAGDKLVVSPAVPFLSVTQTKRLEYIQYTAYETIKINDSSIYKGQTKVKTAGRKGETRIVADVVYKDNKEVSRTVLSSTVLSEPVDRVELVGTKTPPKTAATGKLRRPVNGAYISSNYGYRGREFHTGVDFALAYGSKVMAADGGTVSFAGWKGNYGYLVIINHGNGLQTYYAHNSKLLVRAGQKVAKGDQIAKIGSTGRSSGPHCHFEVRVNGKHVSPWRYIS